MDNIESYKWLFCLDHPECDHLITGIINFNLLVPRQYPRYFAKFYTYPDSDPTAMQCSPWPTSLRCHGALGMPAAALWCYGDLFPWWPHWACFQHVQNLAVTSATLETLLRSAALPQCSMRSHNDPAVISSDLADFAASSLSCVAIQVHKHLPKIPNFSISTITKFCWTTHLGTLPCQISCI